MNTFVYQFSLFPAALTSLQCFKIEVNIAIHIRYESVYVWQLCAEVRKAFVKEAAPESF